MKAKTHYGVGCSHGYLYFVWEDFDQNQYRSWAAARKHCVCPTLCGYYHNFYYNCDEMVDDQAFGRKPTVSQVKEFIQKCKKCLQND